MAGVTFGSPLAGTSGKLVKGTRVLAMAEARFFSVEGASVITGELGPRDITCEHWLHNSYANRAAVEAAYTIIKKSIGKTKTLSNTIGESFPNCLLVEIAENEGPINSPPLGWMYVLTLKWRQLAP